MSPEMQSSRWLSVWHEDGEVRVNVSPRLTGGGSVIHLTREQAILLAADLEWVASLPEVRRVG